MLLVIEFRKVGNLPSELLDQLAFKQQMWLDYDRMAVTIGHSLQAFFHGGTLGKDKSNLQPGDWGEMPA